MKSTRCKLLPTSIFPATVYRCISFSLPPCDCCLPGVSVEIDMAAQKVYVTSSLSSDELLAILKKTGRECSYAGVKN